MALDVIIVGGGPVGLMSAALLDVAGVGVEVYERNSGPSTASKATTMHPRTLEVLTMLDLGGGRRVSDVLVDQGTKVQHAHFAALPANWTTAAWTHRSRSSVDSAATGRA
ncbi:FAD-dependent monooxygenase [Streptomyces sp. x-19]|uniref:FAD-dependent monooxygenase n=1 Tax=Streptomyces sp. x-19 TaxID=2789280 RepID=UPI0039812A40